MRLEQARWMGIEIARAEYVDLTRAVGLGHHIRGWHHRCGRRMCGEAPSFYSTAAIRRWPPENALRADRRAIPTRHRRKGEATVAALDLRHGSGPCDPTIPSGVRYPG
ncbi:MAG TPA: hypothetical protein DDW98_09325, partial [Gammaproteobacteria bacterium]|nr:hypothetical protein [Gammaproteobacteria bacterium]